MIWLILSPLLLALLIVLTVRGVKLYRDFSYHRARKLRDMRMQKWCFDSARKRT